jgi:O-acetylserine/cysteine efflux transporter
MGAGRAGLGANTARPERLGLLFAAACAVNAAFVPAVAKLTTGAADGLFIATASDACAAVAAAVLLGVRGELAVLVRPRLMPRLVLVAALATTLAHLFLYVGASRTNAIVTTLCLQIEPVYSVLLTWVFLAHRPTLRRVTATVALIAGIALAVGAAHLETTAAVWLLLATPLCWQVSHLIVLRTLLGVPPIVLTSARYLYGAALLVPLWLVLDGAAVPHGIALARLLPLVAVQGCVLGYAGTLLWYSAITRIDLARATAIVVPSVPLLSFAVSFVLLGEVASARQWAGLALTAAGVLAFVTAPRAGEPSEPIASTPVPAAAARGERRVRD